MSPEDEQRLHELRAALESEFRDSEGERKSALTEIEDLKGDMLSSLQHVLRHSDNEALKAKVAMWGFGLLVDAGKATADPLASLLDGVPKPSDARTT